MSKSGLKNLDTLREEQEKLQTVLHSKRHEIAYYRSLSADARKKLDGLTEVFSKART